MAIFFFNDTATTEIYTLSLHDALPISSWPVAFELELFEVDAWELAGPALDGLLDVVGGHVDVFGLGDGQAEAGVALGVATSEASGDGDLTDDLGEDLAALGVYGRLVPLRGRPGTMAPHDRTSFSTGKELFDMMVGRIVTQARERCQFGEITKGSCA